jgi:hypothetical protein
MSAAQFASNILNRINPNGEDVDQVKMTYHVVNNENLLMISDKQGFYGPFLRIGTSLQIL